MVRNSISLLFILSISAPSFFFASSSQKHYEFSDQPLEGVSKIVEIINKHLLYLGSMPSFDSLQLHINNIRLLPHESISQEEKKKIIIYNSMILAPLFSEFRKLRKNLKQSDRESALLTLEDKVFNLIEKNNIFFADIFNFLRINFLKANNGDQRIVGVVSFLEEKSFSQEKIKLFLEEGLAYILQMSAWNVAMENPKITPVELQQALQPSIEKRQSEIGGMLTLACSDNPKEYLRFPENRLFTAIYSGKTQFFPLKKEKDGDGIDPAIKKVFKSEINLVKNFMNNAPAQWAQNMNQPIS